MHVLTAFQYFAVAGFINAIILALLLSFQRKNHLANLLMAVLVLLVSFQAILNAFDTRAFFMALPHLSKVSWLTPSLFGPLIYLFTIKLSSTRPEFRKRDLLHFLPFSVYLILLLPWYLQSATVKRAYLDNFELASQDDFGFLNQLSIFIILFYLVLTLRHLRRYRTRINETFSETSHKRIEWMNTFVYALFGILFISAFAFYGRKWDIPILQAIYHYNYALVVLLVYWIAYRALFQPVIFSPQLMEAPLAVSPTEPPAETAQATIPEIPATNDTPPLKRYTRSGLDDNQADVLYRQLIRHMKEHKPYLDPEISIFQLAAQLQVKKHHLSQLINEKAGKNFFDFINEFRVEEMKRNLGNPKLAHLSLLGIALASGFNSKATFNAAFKKIAGMTPSEYQKLIKKED